mgnify:CR=1 FL=1
MPAVNDILEYLWTVAPEEGKESWDNVGLLVGRGSAPVTRLLVALDITMDVIREASELGAELIVSHHPLIWDVHKHVTDRVFQQEKVLELAENRIAAICMHTNLDEAADGVDDTLAEALGLTPISHLAEGRIGHISQLPSPLPLQAFLKTVKDRLGANGLRYCDGGRPVRRIATGCGSCGEYLEAAVAAGCDTFITGDVKYNYFIDALGQQVNLIDAGHFPTENPIVCKLAGKLRVRFPEVEVLVTERQPQPDRFFVE